MAAESNAPDIGGHPAPSRIEPLTFRGSGTEYFRIWIVNLLLTILTLGIYSAWAKVRRLRYFYGNTWLAGASFSYHGEPLAILRGRLIAFAIFILSSVSGRVSVFVGAIFTVLFTIALPWLYVRSRAFQLRMSSYRNIRFRFERDYRGAITVFIGVPILVVLSFGLLLPWWQYEWQEFRVRNASYGRTAFVPEFSGATL